MFREWDSRLRVRCSRSSNGFLVGTAVRYFWASAIITCSTSAAVSNGRIRLEKNDRGTPPAAVCRRTVPPPRPAGAVPVRSSASDARTPDARISVHFADRTRHRRAMARRSTRTGKSAVLRKLSPQNAYVEINPADARQMKISQNELVSVESQVRSKIEASRDLSRLSFARAKSLSLCITRR